MSFNPVTNKKVLLGMSGGVDSSVAAFLLKEQGYDVHGFTLRMWDEDGEEGRCCSREDIQAAMAVSRRIGIPHTVIDIREEFRREVVSYFLDEYRSGRTPNPCALCNQRIRFGSFWRSVDSFGADYLSTGHYAKIIEESGELFLARAKDKRKSQEYFLALIPKERLSRLIFPLGELTKARVRAVASNNNLPVIDRESQDICFIPEGNTASFLRRHLEEKPGNIIDLEGNVLGTHKGIWFHTIGQRKGLGIATGEPLYVVSLDFENGRVIVGPRSALADKAFSLAHVNRFTDRDLSKLPLTCKIRYASPQVGCRLERNKVILDHPVDAITPGQLGVIYWENKVVMGGIISSANP
jgi:tRNA-specific 2-thiouridylase